MGASCWVNYTPYQKDLEQAFQGLRQHVFTSGDYYQPASLHAFSAPRTIEEAVQRGEEAESGTHSILDITRVLTQGQPHADFIATHVKMQTARGSEEGSISSEEYRRYQQRYDQFIGTAMPFAPEDLLHHFGSEKASRAEVEAAIERAEIWRSIPTGIAFYALVYQGNTPQELVFLGTSGD